MRKVLHEYFRPTREEFERLWADARITFDASSLLNLYGYSAETKRELVTAYEKFNKRLILSYQFALEYSRNRTKVISKQISNFQQAEKALNELRDKHKVKSEQPHLSKQSLDALEIIFKELAEGRAKMEKSMASDEESDLLLKLFEGKIGVEPTVNELKSFYSEGKARYDARIPPGFEDLKEKKGEPDCYGDFIAWKQIMAIASSEKKDVILVTDDVKNDWWHKEGSRSVGPLPALRKEFRNVTGQSIWLYTTEGFLRDAKEFSQVKVGDVALSEVKAALYTRGRAYAKLNAEFLREAELRNAEQLGAELQDAERRVAQLREFQLDLLRQTELLRETERLRKTLATANTVSAEDRELISASEKVGLRLEAAKAEYAALRRQYEHLLGGAQLEELKKTAAPEHRGSDDDEP